MFWKNVFSFSNDLSPLEGFERNNGKTQFGKRKRLTEKQALNCKEARELLDGQNWDSVRDDKLLMEHLSACGECAAEANVEAALREVVAPVELERPPANFEAALFARLDLAPQTAEPVDEKSNALYYAGWLMAAVLVGSLAIFNFGYLYNTVSDLILLAYADFAAMFAGRSTLVVNRLFGSVSPGLIEAIALNIFFSILLLGGGLVGLKWGRKIL